MSSSKYDKIGNYNLSYEVLKEAVNEFKGYVLGLSQNDIWLFSEKEENINNDDNSGSDTIDENLGTYLNEIMPRILDRTTGTYFFNSLGSANTIPVLKKYVQGFGSEGKNMLTFVPGYFPNGRTEEDNIFIGGLAEYKDENGISRLQTINDCLRYYNVTGIVKELIKKEVKDPKTGKITLETQYKPQTAEEAAAGVAKIPQSFSSDVEIDDSKIHSPEINRVSDIPDRFLSPSLGALVVQHPQASNAGKGRDHLPIFFNAIPPIEMSRCVPYIDIRVLTENYNVDENGVKTAPNTLNSVAYMRYTKKDGKDNFSLDDSVGFGDLSPVSKSANDDERDALKNIDVAYMDIFTSPQTLSNANINKPQEGKFKDLMTGGINDDPILEPIMPFLSLESLNISITGAGYGIMASKKGSLKLTLHDRSRLKDLAPLVSSSQFATTRILIEYGWNHPEGGPGSDNAIGKYLNALKDRSVYQVVKCDYDFSDGGAVGINIGLAAYGFTQTERVHCGAGPEIPMNVFSEYFEGVSEQLIKQNAKDNKKNKEKAKEVRQKIKLNERSSRSTSNSLSWAAYREIMKALNNKSDSAKTAIKYIFELESITDSEEKIKRKNEMMNGYDLNSDGVISKEETEGSLGVLDAAGSDIFKKLETAGLFQEDTKETMLQRVYGKIKAFRDPRLPDPFLASLVYGSSLQSDILTLGIEQDEPATQKNTMTFNPGMADENANDYVTLGKAIANFIGYPLASTCLYDEVQMIFYPLNHHSGGGRIHTTASLPIPIQRIYDEVQDAVKTSSNISVKRIFGLLERIVKDKNLPVYGISNILEPDNFGFNDLSENDQLSIVLELCCGDSKGYDLKFDRNNDIDKEIQKNYDENASLPNFTNKDSLLSGEFSNAKNGGTLRKRLNGLLSEYRKERTKKIKSNLAKKLKELYTDDGLSTDFPGLDRFIRPNIAMDFEVIDAIRVVEEGSVNKFGSNFIKEIFSPKDVDNGLYENKSILRIHIYDEETVMSPAEHTLLSTVTEGVTGTPIINKENKKSALKIASGLNFNQAKQFIKRVYPTIIYGSAGSTVRTLGVNANTSGQMANILMIESYGNLKQAQVGGFNNESSFESVTMFPNTVSCTLMGMPMIGRGNTIFIDFGTNTSLDNIYTVKNVTHSIRAGDFSTTLELVPSNMGAVQDFASNISEMLKD